jgi:hypothetical protein
MAVRMHREDAQPPAAIERWGWRFHHIGIPTEHAIPGEVEVPGYGMFVSGFESSAYGVQWMRFVPGSPVHEIVRRVPHLAFEVDDLEAALVGKQVITAPNSPSAGVRVAMIVDDGCPIELLQFTTAE